MTTTEARRNSLGFSVIDDNLHRQLFPNFERAVLTDEADRRVRQHYSDFATTLPPVMPKSVQHDWKLPRLQGNTMREHFEKLGKEFAGDYDTRARKLISGIPEMPKATEVLMLPGWHRYVPGQEPEKVDAPSENAIVLDCETYVMKGAFPIIATAVSTEAWYVWLDPALCDLSLEYEPRLYPIGDDKLVFGHNVTYDWQRCIESHWLDVPKGRKRSYFMCTMAMHIVTHGFSGPQRWVVNAKEVPGYAQRWASVGSANSLLACYNFHCWPEYPLTEQDKELRNLFVTQHLPLINARFLELIEYALLDVKYTWELSRDLYPKYRQKRPSWVSLAGVLQQSAHNLPVVDNWFKWLDDCEAKLVEYEAGVDKAGVDIANHVYGEFKVWQDDQQASGLTVEEVWKLHNDALTNLVDGRTPEMRQDWLDLMLDPQYGHKVLNWAIRPRVRTKRGLPDWYREADHFSKSSRLLHLLMKLTYNGKPLIWRGRTAKWCWCDDDGRWHTVTRPGTDISAEVLLTSEFKDLFADGTLTVMGKGADKVLGLCMAMTYWISCRGRAKSQIVQHVEYKNGSCNVITPDLVPTGTVSGRGVSPLWLTVTDAKDENRHRIGVELKSRVQAPPGKVLVSADFSGQELRIGAAYADKIAARSSHVDRYQLGYVGGCLMSHGVYAGTKELGNDSHTMLAKSIGISRGQAKAVAYAMLYGAGRKTVASTIMWDFVHRPEPKDVLMQLALSKADEALKYKKGNAARGTRIYQGGADSPAFTMLALLASESYPETPLLKNKLTAPLCPANCGDDFMTGRANWGIQATARDQADCLTVAFQWLCDKHGVDARHIFLYHDELVIVCDESQADLAAWLLNLSHLWVWAFTNEAMETYDLSDIGKFFDDVIVQKAFRKAHDLSTKTPSNPDENMPDGRLLMEWDMPKLSDQAYKIGLVKCPELYEAA